MKMSKAPKDHIVRLTTWLRFTDEIAQINPNNPTEWRSLKEDWQANEDFTRICKWCEDDEGNFVMDYYFDYYSTNISHIHTRIVWGYEILVDNACDPDLDYLEFKPEIKNLLGIKNH